MLPENSINESQKITIYADMDGVMTKYDYDLYVPRIEGETPPFLQLNRHVFADMEENKNFMIAYNILYNKYRNSELVNVKVLTGIPVGLLQAEHTIDKYGWCDGHIDEFNQEDFFCVSIPKHDAVSSCLWNLTKYDILIDDYPKNLENWRKHGGTAIKCVNGINSVNPDYQYIKTDWSPDRIVQKIESIIQSYTNCLIKDN